MRDNPIWWLFRLFYRDLIPAGSPERELPRACELLSEPRLGDRNSQVAQSVGSSIEELAEAIVQIKRSADETANIVETIDDIAFQRNILACQSPARRDQLAMESNQPSLAIYKIREVLGLELGKAVAPPQLEFLGNPR